jgi:hypothetical protein
VTLATYDAKRPRLAQLYDFFLGGDCVRTPSETPLSVARVTSTAIDESGKPVYSSREFRSYLVPFPAESDKSFECRLALTSYVNVVAPIVDAYAEAVTSNVKRDLGALREFDGDVDLRGATFGELFEECARWTALYGCLAVVVDAPAESDAKSRGDERSGGVKPYAILVHPTAWCWVEVDDYGRVVEFAYTDAAYRTREQTRAEQTVRIRVWTADREGQPGGWKVLQGGIGLGAGETIAGQRGRLDVVAEGPLPKELAGQIPVRFSFYKRISTAREPLGQSLVDDAADIARTILNRRSWEQQIQREAGFPTLAIPMASTGGQMDAQTAIAIGTSKAIGYNANAGAPQWVQPSAEWAKDLREACMQDFQLALRTAGLELAADQSAQVSSGEALRIRSRDFESRAARFARNMKRLEQSVLELYALLAGVPAEFSVEYPKRFTLPDHGGDFARAMELLRSPVEIGRTAKLEAAKQLVSSALALDDAKQTEVAQQIEATLDEDAEAFKQQREVERAERDSRMRGFAPPTPKPDPAAGREPPPDAEE